MPQTEAQKNANEKYRKNTKQINFRLTPQELKKLNMPKYPATEAKQLFVKKFEKNIK